METRKIEGTVQKQHEDSRKVTFVASTTTKDRHGTVLNQNGWVLDRFNANPVIGYQHNVYGDAMCESPNPDDVLGPARAWVEGDNLLVEVDFEEKDINEKADKIYRKIQNGTLRAVSVGFVPTGGGRLVNDETGEEKRVDDSPGRVPKGFTYYFDGQELLEVSVVNIPSNPDALKKSFRDSTANAISYLVKAFGGQYSLSDISNMKVQTVIDILNGKDVKTFNGEDLVTDEVKEKVWETTSTADAVLDDEYITKYNHMRLQMFDELNK